MMATVTHNRYSGRLVVGMKENNFVELIQFRLPRLDMTKSEQERNPVTVGAFRAWVVRHSRMPLSA